MNPKLYVPGIISLLGIFPLLLWKSAPAKQRFDQRVMSVNLPKEGKLEETLAAMFSEEMVLRDISSKKQMSFYLNDFTPYKSEMLWQIRHAALGIKFGYDTSNVVKVVFGTKCTFDDLVSVLNICLMDEHKRYAWVRDSIFIFVPDPPDPPGIYSHMVCGYSDFDYDVFEDQKNKWYVQAFKVLSENRWLVIGYVILTFVTLWWRKDKLII